MADIALPQTSPATAALPIRLAVLEADSLQPGSRARFGHYTGLYTALLASGGEGATRPLRISRHHIVPDAAGADSYPALDEVDALLVSGAKYDADSDAAWVEALVAYVRGALAGGRVRVVGVCFGHQIVARAAGAPVGRALGGLEVSVVTATLSPRGREVFGVETLTLQNYHHDEVLALPPDDAQVLASTPACPLYALLLPDRYLTVQGHPEFDAELMEELLRLRAESGGLPRAVADDGLRRVGLPCDGPVFARAVLRFLVE